MLYLNIQSLLKNKDELINKILCYRIKGYKLVRRNNNSRHTDYMVMFISQLLPFSVFEITAAESNY